MSQIVWTGPVNNEHMRVVEADGAAIAERLLGHDAMGGERWERIHARQAIEDLRAALPKEVTLDAKPERPTRLPYGLVMLPKGAVFRDLTRVSADGTQAMLVRFPVGFAQCDAIEAALSGARAKLVLDGHYEHGAFVASSATHYPKEDEPVLEEHGCKMVTDALREHLRHGNPEERFALSASKTVTAKGLLDMLVAGDSLALRFVQDVHSAALRAVRNRPRQRR